MLEYEARLFSLQCLGMLVLYNLPCVLTGSSCTAACICVTRAAFSCWILAKGTHIFDLVQTAANLNRACQRLILLVREQTCSGVCRCN